jgi:hypothetical protein
MTQLVSSGVRNNRKKRDGFAPFVADIVGTFFYCATPPRTYLIGRGAYAYFVGGSAAVEPFIPKIARIAHVNSEEEESKKNPVYYY